MVHSPAGNFSECRNAEMDGVGSTGHFIELGELVLRSYEADLESFNFAGPPLTFSFGDPGEQVVADLEDAGSLDRRRAKEGAAQATVLMDARSRIGFSALSEGHSTPLEVAKELVPLLVARDAAFLARAETAPAGDEARCPVMTSSG